MARNLEKQKHSLNKYWDHRALIEKAGFDLPAKRPKIASEVNDVRDAKKWWANMRWEIGQKIVRIQNATLPEAEIRDLNDDINKLLKEREYWIARIKELGGEDLSTSYKPSELDGQELYAHSGYKYFGAAKDLPNVRELFEQQHADDQKRRTRKELYTHILPDYYGWRDENDVELLLEEQQAEQTLAEDRKKMMPEHLRKRQGERALKEAADGQQKQISYVYTPSDAEIQQILLEKKRAIALAKVSKYITKEDLERDEEAKVMALGGPDHASKK
ncbi:unnamed protein product [Amoebophrya sp. A25]|nr:unnamed protein product [Amoebophrya sp. A25]|eukprot:GSA25T00017110001.1